MDTCICMAESLHYSPENITALLIGYTPIQNKKFKINKHIDKDKNLQKKKELLFVLIF